MLSKLRAHLTYANVMATVAVFVALGGSSYAALRITSRNVPRDALTGADIKNLTGKDIKTNSVAGNRIKKRSLPVNRLKPRQKVPLAARADRALSADTAVHANTVKGLFLANRKAPELQARLAQTDESTIVLLNAGDAKTLLTNGVYTFVASCSKPADGGPDLVIQVETTVPDTLVALGNKVIQPGSPGTWVDPGPAESSDREVWITLSASLATAPAGPTLNLSNLTYGYNYAGVDCFASMYAVGA